MEPMRWRSNKKEFTEKNGIFNLIFEDINTHIWTFNSRILTTKLIYAMVKKLTITQTIQLNRLHWFGHVQRMEKNRIPKKVLYINLETTRLRGRPRNRWQDEVREAGGLVGGKGGKERVYNREEWKKLLWTARNRHIQHMPMEWMNEWNKRTFLTLKNSNCVGKLHTIQMLSSSILQSGITTFLQNKFWLLVGKENLNSHYELCYHFVQVLWSNIVNFNTKTLTLTLFYMILCNIMYGWQQRMWWNICLTKVEYF